MKYKAPKGTQDLLPEITSAWQFIEEKFRYICHLYGYEEIRIPSFEHTEVFLRVGEGTDVVQKEMYTFEDKASRSMTLRPEGTAGVARSFIEHGMKSEPFPVRLFYTINAFRYENVQKGRYREFHQLGVESYGSRGPLIDAELLAMLNHYFSTLELKNINLEINSLGSNENRELYHEKLLEFLLPIKSELCRDCQNRLLENPLRVLDCKNVKCFDLTKDAPIILDFLDEESEQHFIDLKRSLDNLGVKYVVNPRLVRGLDYYNKTVFEFISDNVGTQGTICGGGRYDHLVENLGGDSTPAIGFALGEERLLLELEAQGVLKNNRPYPQLFIVSIGDEALLEAQRLANKLRLAGARVQYELTNRSFKAQMKYASKSGSEYIMVLGETEIKNGEAEIRSLIDKEKLARKFALNDISNIVKYLI